MLEEGCGGALGARGGGLRPELARRFSAGREDSRFLSIVRVEPTILRDIPAQPAYTQRTPSLITPSPSNVASPGLYQTLLGLLLLRRPAPCAMCPPPGITRC